MRPYRDDSSNENVTQGYGTNYYETPYARSFSEVDSEPVYQADPIEDAQMNYGSQEPPEEKKKKKNFLFWIIFIIALCVFLFSAFKLFEILKANWDEKRELERITEIANIPDDPETPFTIDWAGLREINDHVVAWLIIPDTNISYPVVQGENNSYYLEHTFEKQNNYAGAIFMDQHNKPDFSDNNTFVYGHNVRHGTMFAQLEKFSEKEFFSTHKYVYLFTENQNYKCEIVSFHSTKDRSDYYKYGITDIKEWKSYIDLITDSSINGYVNTDVKMGESDRLISLSTCSYEIGGELTDQRYLLHAKLVPWIGQYSDPVPPSEQ